MGLAVGTEERKQRAEEMLRELAEGARVCDMASKENGIDQKNSGANSVKKN